MVDAQDCPFGAPYRPVPGDHLNFTDPDKVLFLRPARIFLIGPAGGDLHRILPPQAAEMLGNSLTPRGTGGQSPSPLPGGGGGAEAAFPSLRLTLLCALCRPRAGLHINGGHAQGRSPGDGNLLRCLPASPG